MTYRIHFPQPRLRGEITLSGSKSIANRVLIIRALAGGDLPIHGLATARDTTLLRNLLESDEEELDAGAAGTTFRFLTAFLAMQERERVLTGSARMKQRPIGLLVDALRGLGARIDYLGREGYPPLRIHPHTGKVPARRVRMPAGTSSQYISALLLIGPTLPEGLELELQGEVVSRPYIEMTLNIMRYFGLAPRWQDRVIYVPAQPYQPKAFRVEADWSAASYYYALAALAEEANLHLHGLFAESVQGDAVLTEMMKAFGIQTRFTEQGAHLTKTGAPAPGPFRWDFLRCPDLAQTLAVVCGGLGVEGRFGGLQTLRIKETDRIAALQHELVKVGVELCAIDPSAASPRYAIQGQAAVVGAPRFATYEDHRMAMALAPLALLGPIAIEDPRVVDKSYPAFWEDWQQLGCQVEPLEQEAR